MPATHVIGRREAPVQPFDLDRVIWDRDYRRRVLALLNHRPGRRRATIYRPYRRQPSGR